MDKFTQSTRTQADAKHKIRNCSVILFRMPNDIQKSVETKRPKSSNINASIQSNSRTLKLIIEKLDVLVERHFMNTEASHQSQLNNMNNSHSSLLSEDYNWTLHVSTTSEEDFQPSPTQNRNVWKTMLSDARNNLSNLKSKEVNETEMGPPKRKLPASGVNDVEPSQPNAKIKRH